MCIRDRLYTESFSQIYGTGTRNPHAKVAISHSVPRLAQKCRESLLSMRLMTAIPVSYTHLDVYKRQQPRRSIHRK